jgi:peroxiredoxin Q/BCP
VTVLLGVAVSTRVHDFALPNVAAGPEQFRLSTAAERPDTDAIVLLFQRDYHCTKCRQQVQSVAERYDEFEAVDTLVAAVLPEPVGRAENWQDSYELPYPLLADPEKAVGDEYDQPTRFGVLGSLHDLVGRMPLAVVFDTRSDESELVEAIEGKTPADRPSVDDLLETAQLPD